MNSWILAVRPQTLIASIAPVITSTSLCIFFGFFNFYIFVTTFFTAVLLQILANFINDLYDYKKGTDNKDRIGPKRAVQSGLLSMQQIQKGILIIILFCLIMGLYLVFRGGIPILIIGLTSFLFAYLYTATSFAIAYNGLGEIFVILYFGILSSLGTFYLQTAIFSLDALFCGIFIGCLNTSLLIVNNIRDCRVDKKHNKKTLVVIFGVLFGKIELLILLICSYLSLYYLLLNINKQEIFMYFLLTIPIVILIIKDVLFYKEDLELNKVFPKISLLILLLSSMLSIMLVI